MEMEKIDATVELFKKRYKEDTYGLISTKIMIIIPVTYVLNVLIYMLVNHLKVAPDKILQIKLIEEIKSILDGVVNEN